ncbi:unnamed protein product [Cuscuta campestris]|uniref:Methyltransferase n=1 Tax=Cuscuta campestris TaxID=132261 RepID=A0A484LHA9_9ASTE|nr:unnamed protein product [Cuscuta campestris]
MAISSRLPRFLSARTKKTNLYFAAATAVLCSAFYLIGILQHGGASSRRLSAVTVLPSVNCDLHTKNSIGKSDSSGGAFLDFHAHHAAEAETAAEVKRFPACGAELSEYTPCEDTERSLKFDRDMLIYRERHCPEKGEALKCRIPAPFGYRVPVRWPESRDSVWYANVPHKHLTVEKAGQNWVRFKGDRFTFPGGGTMFPRGADSYIDDLGRLINLKDGSIRTAIDTGCGVASWGAYLLSRDILPLSFAPKDTHEAQVQFALERGVPATIGLLASNRLPYPSRAFDLAHCSRCLIPWAQYDGLYLIEVDRILRPGGYWVLSGPPINWQAQWRGWNRTRKDLKEEQDGIEGLARSLCWKKLAQKGDLSIWQKPTNHLHCKANRKVFKKPLFCHGGPDPDTAWYTKMEACLSPLPEVSGIREIAGGALVKWPERLTATPPRIRSGSVGGVSAEAFRDDTTLWEKRVSHYKHVDSWLAERGRFRNVLDMNAGLGGFAAALERGLIGTYHNWCEAMSTYPRTYDFIHADGVFSLYQDRCEIEDIMLEMDRVLRPLGSVIIRDDVDVMGSVKSIADGLQWENRMGDHEDGPLVREKILIATKQYWTTPSSSDVKNQ